MVALSKAMGTNPAAIRQKVRDGEMTLEEAKIKNNNVFKTTRASRKSSDRVSQGGRGSPSIAQKELLKRYKADRKIDVVDNTLDSVVEDCILDIKEAVDNMIEYGDPHIYKVLPKELDEKIRAYGMFAQEYFGKENRANDGMPVYIVPTTYKQCNKCGMFKQESDFYINYSDSCSGHSPICKECATKMFNDYLPKYGIKETLVALSQKMDYLIVEDIILRYLERFDTPKGKADIVKGSFLGNYIGDVNIYMSNSALVSEDMCFMKTNLNGVPFRDIHASQDIGAIYDDVFEEGNTDNLDSLKGIDKAKKKWGNFPPADLRWLEDKEAEWYDKCEITGLSREKLVKQLCYEELTITREREKGHPVKDAVKSFQSLMKDSDLTPKKEVSTSSTSQFSSLGDFIKHAEKTKPIINKNPSLSDVDNVQKLWKSIAGAIQKTLCKDGENIKDLEQNYKDYTVGMFSEDKDSGDESAKSTD